MEHGDRMSIDISAERNRLLQASRIEEFQRELQLTEMVTVYSHHSVDQQRLGCYCALIPSKNIATSLKDSGWDLTPGYGVPGAIRFYDADKKRVEYLRFGDSTGVEPLVIHRNFDGIRPSYDEISEEFRHFHRLFHDSKENRYYKMDDSGNEELIACVEPQRIQIRLKEIRQFIAVKDMHLALFIDCLEQSIHSEQHLELPSKSTRENALLRLDLYFGDFGGLGAKGAFSRLFGKRLIPPLPKAKSGLWGFTDDVAKKYIDFIIGTADDGEEVMHTSDPGRLADYFGGNPQAPHYLTPVHFRKDVLDKYYQQPGKYSVDDNTLTCGSLWSVTIDNHHDDRVVVWLGDLGRDLSYENQLHWRSHNISPAGSVSQTFFKRQVLAQFTDSAVPEHIFQRRYRELADICEKHLGWNLLLPLAASDDHHFKSLRIPATNEQKDFDEVVHSLAKILIDSLNEKSLNSLLKVETQTELKGSISRLECALISHGISGHETHIAFLRKLQNLRSAGTAHRKGSNYQKIASEFGLDSKNLRSAFSGILGMAIAYLEFMINIVSRGEIGSMKLGQ